MADPMFKHKMPTEVLKEEITELKATLAETKMELEELRSLSLDSAVELNKIRLERDELLSRVGQMNEEEGKAEDGR